jgi:hypothetical protein
MRPLIETCKLNDVDPGAWLAECRARGARRRETLPSISRSVLGRPISYRCVRVWRSDGKTRPTQLRPEQDYLADAFEGAHCLPRRAQCIATRYAHINQAYYTENLSCIYIRVAFNN